MGDRQRLAVQTTRTFIDPAWHWFATQPEHIGNISHYDVKYALKIVASDCTTMTTSVPPEPTPSEADIASILEPFEQRINYKSYGKGWRIRADHPSLQANVESRLISSGVVFKSIDSSKLYYHLYVTGWSLEGLNRRITAHRAEQFIYIDFRKRAARKTVEAIRWYANKSWTDTQELLRRIEGQFKLQERLLAAKQEVLRDFNSLGLLRGNEATIRDALATVGWLVHFNTTHSSALAEAFEETMQLCDNHRFNLGGHSDRIANDAVAKFEEAWATQKPPSEKAQFKKIIVLGGAMVGGASEDSLDGLDL